MTNTPYTPVSDAPMSRIPFTPRAEASILELSKWMRISGVISMAAAVLKLIVAITLGHGLGVPLGAIVTFLVGYWSFQAAGAFASVATSDTSDQRYLMDGFGLLRRVFLLQAVMIILALSFAALVIIAGIIYAASR